MYKFNFVINKGIHAGENHSYSLKAKNLEDAYKKAVQWCKEANCTYRTVTKINK